MKLHPYQIAAARFAVSREYSWLTMDCGTGKTAVALATISHLLCSLQCECVLVVAPKRVCQAVWPDEIETWAPWLDWVFLHGPKKGLALAGPRKQVYLVTYEGLSWLFDHKRLPFDAIIFDESSKMKSSDSIRFRRIKSRLKNFKFRLNLSASPRANGLMDLWSQTYLLDLGDRLGKHITPFRNSWFTRINNQFWVEQKGSAEEVHAKIADLCYRVTNEGNLDLPECSEVDVEVSLPKTSYDRYMEFRQELLLLLNKGTLDAINAGVAANRCLQLAGGSVYVEGEVEIFHREKIKALQKIRSEHQGEPLLVLYGYQHEADQIVKAFPDAADLRKGNTMEHVTKWNAGKLPMLIMHPASGGHGLNLQHGGRIVVWFGLNWSYDYYMQANARVWRQGQKHNCLVYRIIAKGTIDEMVISALERKCAGQSEFFRTVLLSS